MKNKQCIAGQKELKEREMKAGRKEERERQGERREKCV